MGNKERARTEPEGSEGGRARRTADQQEKERGLEPPRYAEEGKLAREHGGRVRVDRPERAEGNKAGGGRAESGDTEITNSRPEVRGDVGNCRQHITDAR